MALATFGAAARRNFYLDRHNHVLYANNYYLFVGPTASGKTTAIETGSQLIRSLNERLFLDYKGTEVLPEIPQVRVLPETVTPQRLAQMLHAEPRHEQRGLAKPVLVWPDTCAYLAADEGVTLLGKNLHTVETTVHFLTAIYTKPDYVASTVGRGDVNLRNVLLTIVLGSTVDWLSKSITEDMFGGGFMGRFITVSRPRSGKQDETPPLLDPVLRERLVDRMASVAAAPKTEMRLTAGAQGVVADLTRAYNSMDLEEGWKSGYYARKIAHILKTAMAISLAQHNGAEIEEPDITLARALIEEEEGHLHNTFRFFGGNTEAELRDLVLRHLTKAGDRGISKRELKERLAFKFRNSRSFDEAMEYLVSTSQVRFKAQHSKARCGWYFIRTPGELAALQELEGLQAEEDAPS